MIWDGAGWTGGAIAVFAIAAAVEDGLHRRRRRSRRDRARRRRVGPYAPLRGYPPS